MSNFEIKKEKALQLLDATGIARSNYLPPATRLLWRMGMEVPPPHFASFGKVALVAGSYFAVAWGTIMLVLDLFLFRTSESSLTLLAAASAAAGALFGLSIAGYYAYGRRKHKLPRWEQVA